jgi:hypothetical protein
MMNFGDWQSMPDYRDGWKDKNKNAFGGMLRAMDPMTYVPGVNVLANSAHDIGGEFVSGANRALSPLVKGTNQVLEATTPGVKQMHEAVPALGNVNRFIEDKPFDAAALAAATFFSGGAAAKAMGAGAAAAPAASGGAGAMGGLSSAGAAGTSAITPSFASGAVGAGAGAGAAGSTTGSLVGAGAITPGLASGTYGGIAGAAGTGTLGTAGTAASGSALTPSFMAMGASAPSFMDTAGHTISKGREFKSYHDNINRFSGPDTDKARANNQANSFAQKILDSNSVPTTATGRIANKIIMKRPGGR